MKQSFILISEISEETLLDGLMEFANLYANDEFSRDIILNKKGNEFLVTFTNVPSFDHFAYAVNFLKYLKTPNKKLPSVFGYYFITAQGENNYSFLVGEFAKVYISRNDNQYDNVNVVNHQNRTYLFDFGGKQNKLSTLEESFEVPQIDFKNYNHVLNIIPAPVEYKPWWKFW